MIREFLCAEGHVTEVISVGKLNDQTIPCRTCHQPADRIPSTVALAQGAGPKESPLSRAIGRVKALPR